MLSIPFEISENGRTKTKEYLPKLLLSIAKTRRTAGLRRNIVESINGLTMLHIPMYISHYERRNRGILFLCDMMSTESPFYLPSITLHDPESLQATLSEANYDQYTITMNSIINSLTMVEKTRIQFTTLTTAEICSEVKEFCPYISNTSDDGSYLLDASCFDENEEIAEIHELLETQEQRLLALPENLNQIDEILSEKTRAIVDKLSVEKDQVLKKRRRERRQLLDELKMEASNIKQEIYENREAEEDLLEILNSRRETAVFRLNETKLSLQSQEKNSESYNRLKSAIQNQTQRLHELDSGISDNKKDAREKREELHGQLIDLEAQMDDYDQVTQKIDFGYKGMMDDAKNLLEQYQQVMRGYINAADNELSVFISSISIDTSSTLPDIDLIESSILYMPTYIALIRDDRQGVVRYAVYPFRFGANKPKSLLGSVLGMQKKDDHPVVIGSLVIESLNEELAQNKEFEMNVLNHFFRNSIISQSSKLLPVIHEGCNELKTEGILSEKEVDTILCAIEGGQDG